MPRTPTKQRNPIPGATRPDEHEIGDEVFFALSGVAGEALFIGQLRHDPHCLVLALPEDPCIEMSAAYCSQTGHIDPKQGHSLRRECMKRFPGKLK